MLNVVRKSVVFNVYDVLYNFALTWSKYAFHFMAKFVSIAKEYYDDPITLSHIKNVQDWPISQKLNQWDALRDLVPFVQFEKLDIGVLL